MNQTSWYSRFSQAVARVSGRPQAFASVLVLTLAWGVTGPIFHFSDTWQLVMNTISSVVTFLMVFVIQNSQNRQSDALQIKLDELIRATAGAHNILLDLEELELEDLAKLRARYIALARLERLEQKDGKSDTDTREA